ncbi:hypothetical protein J2Z69_001624 [Paenibacillus shirakamiensis]|uniref:Uncharacterized protein n=1 Tax=Paenibacillus shirakamiensis TaxID=1265935 RepID=A0ABS4JFV9_9BACL|nr:Imm50 family immunity protein [Paenibacillus shirakamiensis]MBP2000593.1 hypothetical protein [Paenibacillus shirakamiensis]
MIMQVQHVEKKDGLYHIQYIAGGPLPFDPHDVVLIRSAHYFIGSIMEVHPSYVVLLTHADHEPHLAGTLELELAFSPTVSILGAEAIIEKLGYFPPFHYDRITDASLNSGNISLTIELSATTVLVPQSADLTPSDVAPLLPEGIFTETDIPRYAITFIFDQTTDVGLTPLESENIILQLDFRYEDTDMVIDIDALRGLSGSFLCGGIRAEIVQL